MTFWRKMLLLYMVGIQAPTALKEVKGQIDPTLKAKLRCFICLSHKSWEDCDKNSKKDSCSSRDDACLKMTVHRWEMLNGTKTGRVLTHYTKYCTPGEYCSDKQCTEMGWKCTVDCCNQDLCNANVAIWANNALIAVLLVLAVCNILIAF